MFKFKKIYLTLTASLACAALSVSALAVPETSASDIELGVEETTIAGEEPPVIIGADVTEPVIPDFVPSMDTAPADELISPPYDPNSGDPPPVSHNSGGMFSNYETGTGSIEDIEIYWNNNGYPDYISFICDEGVVSYEVATQITTRYPLWKIGIADISEEKMNEVRSLISSEQHLYFVPCRYNLTQRRQIKAKIEENYPLADVWISPYSENIEVYLDNFSEDEKAAVKEEILAMFGGESNIIDVLEHMPLDGEPEIGAAETVPAVVTAPITVEETAVASNIDVNPPTEAPGGNVMTTEVPQTEAAAASENISDIDGDPNGYSTDSRSDYDIGGELPEKTADAAKEIGEIIEEIGGAAADNPEVSNAVNEIGEVAAMMNTESRRDTADSLWIWVCAAAATVVVIAAAVILGRRHAVKNVGLADGGEISVGGRAAKGEVVKAVKESEIEPGDNTFGEIMEKIEKNK